MKRISVLTALAFTAATPWHTSASSTSHDKLEEIVVTSSRIPMPLRQVATSVSVVTKDEIRIRGFSNIADVLRFEPGISVTNNGGQGKATTVRVRGENGYRTKLYIDGIDMTDNSQTQASPNFENLLSAGIDRVEILRGPEGLAYGADAGGVITLSTAAPEAGFDGGIEAEGGRYGTQQYTGHVGGGSELVDFTLLGARYETDGFNSLTTDNVLQDDDGYTNTTFHGRGGWNITDGLRAEVVGRTVEGDNDYDNCLLPVTFDRTDKCTNDFDQDAMRVALVHEGEAFTNTVSYNENQTDRKFYTEGFNDFSYKSELESMDYLGSWRHSDPLTLIYGTDLQKDSMNDGVVDENRDQEGYFLEYKGGFNNNIFVTAGARYTDNEDFGTKTTYRTGAVYLVEAGEGEIKFKGTYGTGFRAPSLYEISYNDGPFALPPAQGTQLSAEETEGYDLGVGYYAAQGWYVDAVYFDQSVNDEIYFDLVAGSGYLQGEGESTSQGMELSSQVPLNDIVALTGNYTYTDTQESDGEQRLRVPKNMGNIGVLVTPWDGRLKVNVNYRVARDTAVDIGGQVDDYEVLDLSASYQVLDALEVYGRIENLTDENYQEIPDYNTSGAAGYAGLRYTF
jgi:vitamin B12 transporter